MTARQVIVGAENHFAQVTTSRRSPWCRFDHKRAWHIETWDCEPETMTVGEAIDALGSLQVEGHFFVTEMACAGCGRKGEKSLRLNRRWRGARFATGGWLQLASGRWSGSLASQPASSRT